MLMTGLYGLCKIKMKEIVCLMSIDPTVSIYLEASKGTTFTKSILGQCSIRLRTGKQRQGHRKRRLFSFLLLVLERSENGDRAGNCSVAVATAAAFLNKGKEWFLLAAWSWAFRDFSFEDLVSGVLPTLN